MSPPQRWWLPEGGDKVIDRHRLQRRHRSADSCIVDELRAVDGLRRSIQDCITPELGGLNSLRHGQGCPGCSGPAISTDKPGDSSSSSSVMRCVLRELWPDPQSSGPERHRSTARAVSEICGPAWSLLNVHPKRKSGPSQGPVGTQVTRLVISSNFASRADPTMPR